MKARPEKKGGSSRARLALLLSVALVLGVVAFAMHVWPRLARLVRARSLEASVVLVVVDTLRADRVGCMGGPGTLTPGIDALATEAVVFTHAYAHAPFTLPSVASLYTSTLPAEHGAGGRLGELTLLSPDAVTVAEVFERSGASTAAVTNVVFLGPAFGMDQGFTHVDQKLGYDNRGGRDATDTTDDALSWLEHNRDRPFFLLVHYFDPHLTYDPPEPFRSRHAAGVTLPAGLGTARDVIKLRTGKRTIDEGTITDLEKLYDGEVAYTDSEVGRLVDGMRRMGILDGALVAVTSDHGEEFADHGGFEHGHTLYDELLHVPLVIRPPGGVKGGAVVDAAVRLVDLAPTLCQVAGIRIPSSFAGRSLVEMFSGAGEDRPHLAQGNMWGPSGNAWRTGGLKLILSGASEPPLLFDTVADPREAIDLSADRPEDVERMTRELEAVLAELGASVGEPADLTPGQIEMLRQLGYVR